MQQLIDLETAFVGADLRCAFTGQDLLIALDGKLRLGIGGIGGNLAERSHVEALARSIGQIFKLADLLATV